MHIEQLYLEFGHTLEVAYTGAWYAAVVMAGAVAIAAAGAFAAGTCATEAGATATPDIPCYIGI